MANPNIVNVATINGNTKAAAVGTTITEICSNATSSGKIFKVNSLYISNIDGTTAADLTVNHYSQAALGGTAIAIASTISVAADSTLVVITKDSAFYLLENQSLGCLCATSGDLQFVASWDEIS
jgi:hypothetical protein